MTDDKGGENIMLFTERGSYGGNRSLDIMIGRCGGGRGQGTREGIAAGAPTTMIKHVTEERGKEAQHLGEGGGGGGGHCTEKYKNNSP